ncbi:hypothetical protein MVEN_00614900 [Mycena venus]|uniref:Uncharacterized protein n=1 Tax=Mycena venus TaxID=2733690 RepID=A0A8H6YK26_9AGAR|nr:hypothetical protein MVEN_00614900 [Mycena venus]
MLTPLAFSPTTLTAHWMDSPFLPAAAFDLTSHFGPSPFPDAGRPGFESPSRVYYPVRPLDSEGDYNSPKIAFKKQVAANKKDPRWEHAGIGLGVGLAGVETRYGVLQYSYTLSRPPTFVRPTSQKAAAPGPVKAEAPAASLWNALTEFLDTTYSLLSPPDSPTPPRGRSRPS